MNAATTTAAVGGMWASAFTAPFTLVFAVLLRPYAGYLDCFICLPLAISYLIVTIGNKNTVTGGKVVCVDVAIALAVIYCNGASIGVAYLCLAHSF
jgi:hypothetical protein